MSSYRTDNTILLLDIWCLAVLDKMISRDFMRGIDRNNVRKSWVTVETLQSGRSLPVTDRLHHNRTALSYVQWNLLLPGTNKQTLECGMHFSKLLMPSYLFILKSVRVSLETALTQRIHMCNYSTWSEPYESILCCSETPQEAFVTESFLDITSAFPAGNNHLLVT